MGIVVIGCLGPFCYLFRTSLITQHRWDSRFVITVFSVHPKNSEEKVTSKCGNSEKLGCDKVYLVFSEYERVTEMRLYFLMFITGVCFLFLLKIVQLKLVATVLFFMFFQ